MTCPNESARTRRIRDSSLRVAPPAAKSSTDRVEARIRRARGARSLSANMADDDGLISGLTEEQLITNEEMDALVKEVSNPALARPARAGFYLVRRSVVPRPRRSHRPPTRPPRPRRRSSKPSAPTVSCTRRSTSGRPTSWYVAASPIRAHPVLRPSLGTRASRAFFSPTFTRAREPSSPRTTTRPRAHAFRPPTLAGGMSEALGRSE